MNNQGKTAEQAAAKFLRQKGLKIIETNFAVTGGEVDIIAKDKQTLVFVEVRYRKLTRFGSAEESINHKKQQRIIKASTIYLQQQQLWDKIACRFDVVCFNGTIENPVWEKSAFGL